MIKKFFTKLARWNGRKDFEKANIAQENMGRDRELAKGRMIDAQETERLRILKLREGVSLDKELEAEISERHDQAA